MSEVDEKAVTDALELILNSPDSGLSESDREILIACLKAESSIQFLQQNADSPAVYQLFQKLIEADKKISK